MIGTPRIFLDSLFEVFVVCRDDVTSMLRDAVAEAVVGIRASILEIDAVARYSTAMCLMHIHNTIQLITALLRDF